MRQTTKNAYGGLLFLHVPKSCPHLARCGISARLPIQAVLTALAKEEYEVNNENSRQAMSEVEKIVSQAEKKVADIADELQSSIDIHEDLVCMVHGVTAVIWENLKTVSDISRVVSAEEECNVAINTHTAVLNMLPVIRLLKAYLEEVEYSASTAKIHARG